MSLVNVINVIVVNPKSSYSDSIAFEIFFEALQPLQHSKSQSLNLLLFLSQAPSLSFANVKRADAEHKSSIAKGKRRGF